MGLKIETWSIAYRKKKDGLIIENTSDFKVIDNGHKGWYADPFLFDYKGNTYLFAEYYSYDIGRGVIVYAVYDEKTDSFSEFKEIIREDYHLSYPLVFQGEDGQIYMMPESNQKEELYLYRAVSFPFKWKKEKIIMNGIKVVDTTPFQYQNKNYAFSLKLNNQLLLLRFGDGIFEKPDVQFVTDDMSFARPGGHVFDLDGNKIFVSQDCSGEYGKAVNLLNFKLADDKDHPVEFSLLKKITAEQVGLINEKPGAGIHTYNFSEKLEVIDIKYYRKSYYRLLKRIIKK